MKSTLLTRTKARVQPVVERASTFRDAVSDYVRDEAFDQHLDQGVEFLKTHGFGGHQLRHLFGLQTRRQKFLYIASVTGATVAVTFFSRGWVGRSLRRVPFLK